MGYFKNKELEIIYRIMATEEVTFEVAQQIYENEKLFIKTKEKKNNGR